MDSVEKRNPGTLAGGAEPLHTANIPHSLWFPVDEVTLPTR